MVYVLWEVRSPGSSCMLTGEIFTDPGGPWRLRGPGPPAAAILCIAAPPISIALPALRTSLDDFRAILRPSCQVRPSAVLTFLYRIWLKSRPRRSNRLSLPSRSSPPRESSTRETNRKPLLFFFFLQSYDIRFVGWTTHEFVRERIFPVCARVQGIRTNRLRSDKIQFSFFRFWPAFTDPAASSGWQLHVSVATNIRSFIIEHFHRLSTESAAEQP